MPGSASLLKYEAKNPVKLCCKIDLDKLLSTQTERRRFDDIGNLGTFYTSLCQQ
jgi:hypothetical protein